MRYAIKVLGIVEFQNVPHKELVLDAQDFPNPPQFVTTLLPHFRVGNSEESYKEPRT